MLPRKMLVLWDSIWVFVHFYYHDIETYYISLFAIPVIAFVTKVLISLVVETDTPGVDEDWKRDPCLLNGCVSKLPVPTAREHSPDMQNEQAFIQDGYIAMPGPVRKASRFKDLKCHQIVATVTLPSGLQASEYPHSLRQHTP